MGDASLRVAKEVRSVGKAMSWHNTQHPISWLQDDIAASQHIEVTATYSRHLATGTSAHIDAA